MRRFIVVCIFLLTNYIFSQDEIFPKFPKKPTERVFEKGEIEVSKSLYGLTFKKDIPQIYRKSVAFFFRNTINPKYKTMKTYKLQVANRFGYIWIENTRTCKIEE